jgi:hypothetical protein
MKSREGWTERIASRWLMMNHCCSSSAPLFRQSTLKSVTSQKPVCGS